MTNKGSKKGTPCLGNTFTVIKGGLGNTIFTQTEAFQFAVTLAPLRGSKLVQQWDLDIQHI